MKPPRKRVQAIAQGRGRDQRVVVPLAFEVAARISARPPDVFRSDPTQLANGLGELQQAIAADGVVCALAGGMERASSSDGVLAVERLVTNGPLAASLEACRRLRAVHGDALALLAGVSGPATLARDFAVDDARAAAAFGALCKAFCEAGADVLLVVEEAAVPSGEDYADGLRTAANIARFHQACLLGGEGTGLPQPVTIALETPGPGAAGIVTTAAPVPADADIAALRAWVAAAQS